MDDSFGSIIYIIIALVAFIISALGKKKKKEAQSRPIRTVSDTDTYYTKEKSFISNIGQLLNEELGLENAYSNNFRSDPIKNIPQAEKEVALDTVPPHMLDNIPDVPYSIEFEDTRKIFDDDAIKNSEITNIEKFNPILEDFDLKKAVIASEILNRREY